uniref:Uncharacterized protein n=1 Tax=Triticum urartu TaxID=4572 RepID=A0A8R7R3L9_TRIUA
VPSTYHCNLAQFIFFSPEKVQSYFFWPVCSMDLGVVGRWTHLSSEHVCKQKIIPNDIIYINLMLRHIIN